MSTENPPDARTTTGLPGQVIVLDASGTPTWQTPARLWPCGCLINDAGAHRVGCPDHPEGVRG